MILLTIYIHGCYIKIVHDHFLVNNKLLSSNHLTYMYILYNIGTYIYNRKTYLFQLIWLNVLSTRKKSS